MQTAAPNSPESVKAPEAPEAQFPPDAFGDRFDLACLPLPRAPRGYAVQMLDSDLLLDGKSGEFLPVRSATLGGLFASFDDAHTAAACWARRHGVTPETHRLAIVPAGYDDVLKRHILIYGVLCDQP